MNKKIVIMIIIVLLFNMGCTNKSVLINDETTSIIKTKTKIIEIEIESLIEPIVEEKKHNKISGEYYFYSAPINKEEYQDGVNYIIVTDNSIKVSGYYKLEEEGYPDVYDFMENEFILNDETVYYDCECADGEHRELPLSKNDFKRCIELLSNSKEYTALGCRLKIKDGIVLKAGVYS